LHYRDLEFSKALEAIWTLLAGADKFIVEQAPWIQYREAQKGDTAAQERLHNTLYSSAEILRIASALVSPVLPDSAQKIWESLGQKTPLYAPNGEEVFQLKDLKWGQLEEGTPCGEPTALYPRLELEASVQKMQELEEEALKEQAEILGKQPAAETIASPKAAPAPILPAIDIEEFAKVDLRVGEVKTARRVEKADRLLHLTVDIGEAEPRSIVAGIAAAYDPETLIGRKVVIVANLKPRKLRGLESNGMIVAAIREDGKPALAGFHEAVPLGASLR
jgi:methionyl-tRNA synthetase